MLGCNRLINLQHCQVYTYIHIITIFVFLFILLVYPRYIDSIEVNDDDRISNCIDNKPVPWAGMSLVGGGGVL